MDTGDTDVKRRLDTASRAIRVMTVHGAKGLESPIVILPDTARRSVRPRSEILRLDDGAEGPGAAVWRTASGESPEGIAAAVSAMAAREAAERMRLLYVAMTRAESWLIVCAAGDTGTGEQSWYALIEAAMEKAGAVTAPPDGGAFDFGPGKRVELGRWPDDLKAAAAPVAALPPLPDWAGRRAPHPVEAPAVLAPSALGGAKALAGETGAAGWDEAAAMRRGTALHRLLEHLPLWPRADWPAIADALVQSLEDGPDPAETEPLLAEAARVLTDPALAVLFAPGTLAEVELTATLPTLGGRRVQGTIDRLVIDRERILAIDFKSNVVVPADAGTVPDGLLRQMGAYAEMLAQIYPDRRIETAILWTKAARLMPLPHDIVRAALATTSIP
jgi:ATP-dependent helicase/nuclease subunit A